jgi:hypothetical protein
VGQSVGRGKRRESRERLGSYIWIEVKRYEQGSTRTKFTSIMKNPR